MNISHFTFIFSNTQRNFKFHIVISFDSFDEYLLEINVHFAIHKSKCITNILTIFQIFTIFFQKLNNFGMAFTLCKFDRSFAKEGFGSPKS